MTRIPIDDALASAIARAKDADEELRLVRRVLQAYGHPSDFRSVLRAIRAHTTTELDRLAGPGPHELS